MSNADILRDMREALSARQGPSPYDSPATVSRIDIDGTAWVRIAGSETETPVRLTINAKAGDTVQVRVGGGTAWLVGNQTAPPTDDTKAEEAIEEAVKAGRTASDFVADTSDGIFVHPRDNMDDGVRITNAIEIIKSKVSYFKAWIDGNIAKVRVGREDEGNTVIDSNGLRVYGGDGTERLANIGYGDGYDATGQIAAAPYYELGKRATGAGVGNYSTLMGEDNEASGKCSVAEGKSNTIDDAGYCAHVGGYSSEATAPYAFAHGVGLQANFARMAVFGRYNAPNEQLFCVGNGQSGARKNAFQIDQNGNIGIQGTLYSSSNDQLVTKMFKRSAVARTTSASINAGGTARVEINVADIGYTPMSIAGVLLSNSNFSYYAATLSGSTAIIYVKNNSSSADTVGIDLVVFYIASTAL